MDELIQTMADDWTKVFPKAKVLNQFHVKKFAGLNPDHLEDRVRFGKHLGMKKGLVEMLSELTQADIDAISGDDSAAEDDAGRPTKARKFGPVLDDFPIQEPDERVACFNEWVRLGRTLLSLPTITDQRGVLQDLNVMLCHVRKRSLSSLILRWQCGLGIQRCGVSTKIKGLRPRTALTFATSLVPPAPSQPIVGQSSLSRLTSSLSCLPKPRNSASKSGS